MIGIDKALFDKRNDRKEKLTQLYTQLLLDSEHVVSDLETVMILLLREHHYDYDDKRWVYEVTDRMYFLVKKLSCSLETVADYADDINVPSPECMYFNATISDDYCKQLQDVYDAGLSEWRGLANFNTNYEEAPYTNCVFRFMSDMERLLDDLKNCLDRYGTHIPDKANRN